MSISRRTLLKSALLASALGATASLGGCAWWTRAGRIEAVPPPKVQPKERTVTPVAASQTLRLDVIYYQRIALPPGGTLSVDVLDSRGRRVGQHAVAAGAGQPYKVQMSLQAGALAPLQVMVTLKPPGGPTLSGRETFRSVPSGYTEFIISSAG